MKKSFSFVFISLALFLNLSANIFASVQSRYKLIGTIISSEKNKSLAIIKDTKTSETKVLQAGRNLDHQKGLFIRSVDKDKVILVQRRAKQKNQTINLYRNPGELARERESGDHLEEMKNMIEKLNDLKELRAYFKKREKELKDKAKR